MARFSERIGVKPPKTVLQVDSMDDDLRNGLWNSVVISILPYLNRKWHYSHPDSYGDVFFQHLCLWHYKEPLDQLHYDMEQRVAELRKRYYSWDCSGVYDFIEFVAKGFPESGAVESFIKNCDAVLGAELSGYRFVGRQLAQITNDQELASVQKALELPNPLKPVRLHFQAAVDLFSDRKSPDYRNSVKESISAVAAICKIITGLENAMLPETLKRLEDKAGRQIHSALKKSFISLYGYTRDAKGIHHALLDEAKLDFDDAKSCLSRAQRL